MMVKLQLKLYQQFIYQQYPVYVHGAWGQCKQHYFVPDHCKIGRHSKGKEAHTGLHKNPCIYGPGGRKKQEGTKRKSGHITADGSSLFYVQSDHKQIVYSVG